MSRVNLEAPSEWQPGWATAPSADDFAALADRSRRTTIVTALDANYVPCFSACLLSIAESAAADAQYEIVLLGRGISQAQFDLLLLQVRRFPNVAIRHVDMADEAVDRGSLSGHFTGPTFFRFKLTELLPDHDKVVYLDPDTIVLDDLAKLFATDIADGYAAAVLDYTMKLQIAADFRISDSFGGVTRQEYWNDYLKLSPRAQSAYFNAGVMVFNLDKMRRDDISRQLYELHRSGPFDLHDQDILNKVFDGRIVHLEPRWNVITQPLDAMTKLPPALFQEFAAAHRNPAIVHFAGWYLKPWQYENVDFAEYFWMFSRRTAFYEKSFQVFLHKFLLEGQQSHLEKLQATMASLQQTVEAERERLQRLDGDYASLRQSHEAEREKLQRLHGDYASLRQSHEAEREERERLGRLLAQAQQNLATLQSILESNFASRTWRLLRAIGRPIGKLFPARRGPTSS